MLPPGSRGDCSPCAGGGRLPEGSDPCSALRHLCVIARAMPHHIQWQITCILGSELAYSHIATQVAFVRSRQLTLKLRTCRYLAQLLRTTPMESLLNRHVDMTGEIKTLDSDMQVRCLSSRPSMLDVAFAPVRALPTTARISMCLVCSIEHHPYRP